MIRRRLLPSLLIVSGLVIILGVVLFITWLKTPLLSPVNIQGKFSFLKPTQLNRSPKIVYGFLPYWNLEKAKIHPELTHLGLFALVIQANGSLQTTQEGYNEPGYNALKSKSFLALSNRLISSNQKQEIVLAQFNADIVSQFLYSEAAQDNLLETLDSLLLAYPFSGVNIDIEYAGEMTDSLPNKLNQFVQKLDQHLEEKYPDVKLSIDIFASAGSRNTIWDIETLAKHVDYIVVMAYDYHRPSSVISGPVAPLFDNVSKNDISDHLDKILEKVPPEKILLGVPFYGYEWQTVSRDSSDHTYPDSGSTASYKRVLELLEQKEELELEEHWNEDALSPYITYQENGQTYTIYYENSRSLSYKLDLVNQLDLAGMAIWALGYEGYTRDLWDVIEKKVR